MTLMNVKRLLCTDHGKGKKGDYCTEDKRKIKLLSVWLSVTFSLESWRHYWLLKLGLEATACVYQSWQFVIIITEMNLVFILLLFFPLFCLFHIISAVIWEKNPKLSIFFFSFCTQLVTEHAFEIPDNIRPGHLIKELSKVIRSVEVRTEAALHKSSENKSLNRAAPSKLCFWVTIFTF